MITSYRNAATSPLVQWTLGWLAFLLLLLWSWRVNLWSEMPNYGDAIEVVWGILWYREALDSDGLSVFHYPWMFYPDGWQVGTLAHRPLNFLLYQPLTWLGGAVFAFNSLAILSLVVTFAGAKRLFALYTNRWIAITAALIYTFTFTRFDRLGGHVHVSLGTTLLPWLAWQIELLKTEWDRGQYRWRPIVWVSLFWAGIINFVLYGIFWGAMMFLLLGRQLVRLANWKYLSVMVVLTITFSLPSLIPYYAGATSSESLPPTMMALVSTGMSLNNAPSPGRSHVLPFLGQWARQLNQGSYDETATIHFGMITIVLAVWGSYKTFAPNGNRWRIWLCLISFVLALGVVLRWDNRMVTADVMEPVNQAIWAAGHRLKPDVFNTPRPPEPLANGVPLPSMGLLLFVPFWESARVMARYAFVTLLMAVGLASVGLRHLARPLQIVFVILWALEMWPVPTAARPFSVEMIHPAYQWLAEQPAGDQHAIIDLNEHGVLFQAEILWATYLHRKPTVSNVGSFIPQHTANIFSLLSIPYTDLQTVQTWQTLGVRYVVLHRQNLTATEPIWQALAGSDQYAVIGCFVAEGQPVWPYEICIAEVQSTAVNIAPEVGWSAAEPWGMWTVAETAEGRWIATETADVTLTVEAFPHCIADQQQTILIEINDQPLVNYEWQECETWLTQHTIPAELVNYGWNKITFEYAYAIRPIEATDGANPDERPLAVGFSQLNIRSSTKDLVGN